MSFVALCEEGLYTIDMHYVYILQSEEDPSRYYYGQTTDVKNRLNTHNSGGSPHTAKYKPWKVVWYACFATTDLAAQFEHYLKTASGKAFARKRLI